MEISNSIMELLRMELDRDAYEDWEFRRAAVYALNDVSQASEWLDKARKDPDWRVRYAAVKCFSGRNISLGWIEDALKDDIPNVRAAAVKSMQDRHVPLDLIKIAIEDASWVVREEAVYLCKSRLSAIPHSWITYLQNDEEVRVRVLARKEL